MTARFRLPRAPGEHSASLGNAMTNPILTLEGVSHVLPDGRTLFSDLNETFDARHTGLVGRNGVGKTVLARILAGQVTPSTGRCLRSGRVHYLAQQVAMPEGSSVASLAGVRAVLDALARIEAGSVAPEDFEAVGEQWDMRERLGQALARHELGHLDVHTPANTLSGGEAMRVALLGAWLSEADVLIFDEPSNHLDRPGRQALIAQLQRWTRGLIVISHDRQLLGTMQHIVELTPLGLRSYGGNYTFYTRCKAQERENARTQLGQCKLERQREEQSMRIERERQERRQARGAQHGRQANQANILLGRQKERSQASAGKLHRQHEASRQQLDRRVREAARQLQDEAAIVLRMASIEQAAQRRVVELDAVALPFLSGPMREIALTVTGQQRVGVVGPNGCGKSTLLSVLAGRLSPVAGVCKVVAERAFLDQRLIGLDPKRSVLAQVREANSAATEADLRTRLAQLGLDAGMIALPSAALSGGERLKAALACALHADPPPRLLVLDEPGNHLDFESTQALEAMLRDYRGALVVASHDDAFLASLGLTHRLMATARGWRAGVWSPAAAGGV